MRLGGVLELDLLEAMVKDRENSRYLPGVPFPPNLVPEPELAKCLDGARDVLVVVPSHGLRDTLTRIQPLLAPDARICWATKGFELHTGKLPHQVAEEVLGSGRPMAVLSGPTFAKEVAEGLPTALTIAANDQQFAAALANADRVVVPDLRQQPVTEAVAVLREKGLQAKISGNCHRVQRQEPPGGTPVSRGSTVTLIVGDCVQ